jgi:hypothetical protein
MWELICSWGNGSSDQSRSPPSVAAASSKDNHRIPTKGYTSRVANTRKDPSRSRSQNQIRSPSIPSQSHDHPQSRVHRSRPENQTHARSPRRRQTHRGPLRTNATARQQSLPGGLQLCPQGLRIFQIPIFLMKISPTKTLPTSAIPAKRHDYFGPPRTSFFLRRNSAPMTNLRTGRRHNCTHRRDSRRSGTLLRDSRRHDSRHQKNRRLHGSLRRLHHHHDRHVERERASTHKRERGKRFLQEGRLPRWNSSS